MSDFKSLRDELRDFVAGRGITDHSATATPPAGPANDCARCGGTRHVRHETTDTDDPDFGRAMPCPDCGHRLVQKRLQRLIRDSSLRRHVTKRFEDFTPRPDQQNAYAVALAYAADPHGLLTFLGTTGTAKTHLAAAIAWRYAERRGVPAFYTAAELLGRIQGTFGVAHDEPGNTEQVVGEFKTVPLLVVDEIGAENPTGWAQSKLFEIIGARYDEERPTVLTTNLTPSQLEPRLASRVMDTLLARVLVLNGPDHRGLRHAADVPPLVRFDPTAKAGDHHKLGGETRICAVCNCLPCHPACPEQIESDPRSALAVLEGNHAG